MSSIVSPLLQLFDPENSSSLFYNLLKAGLISILPYALRSARSQFTRMMPCSAPPLFLLARDMKWEELIERCRTDPKEVHYRSRSNGFSVLHMVCVRAGPLSAVKALLEIHPALRVMQDKSGCTPLHIASVYACEKVVEELLNEGGGKVASLENNLGRTPVEYFWWLNDAFFLKSEIDSILHMGGVAGSIGGNDSSSSSSGTSTKERLRSAGMCMEEFWNKAALLLKATHDSMHKVHNDTSKNQEQKQKQKNQQGEIPLLHMCSRLGKRCPRTLFQTVMSLYPDQISSMDHEGNLPLHLAARDAGISASGLVQGKHKDVTSYAWTVEKIVLLIHAQPQAAKVKNHQGQLPLALLLQGAQHFTSVSSSHDGTAEREESMLLNHAVAHLLKAYPAGAMEMDPTRRMFPFMALAVSNMFSLDVVYSTLRSFPELERLQPVSM